MKNLPPALVTDVVGVVRSLGDAGIRSIVASEYQRSPTFWSRHCAEKCVLPSMGEEPEKALQVLLEVGSKLSSPIPMLTGRESDARLVSRFRKELARYFRLKLAPTELCEALGDKGLFSELARKYDLAIPRTWNPKNDRDLTQMLEDLQFPCILKPNAQTSWGTPEIFALVGRWRKAFRIDTREEFDQIYPRLRAIDPLFIVQEYISGGDDALFSLHAYAQKQGTVSGYFLGRKIRTNPIHFGRGSYARSWHDSEIAKVGIEALERIQYVGAAGMNLKRDPISGRTFILEINPRFSLWNHLAARSGVNLALANYNDLMDLPLPPLHQDVRERRWLYFYLDAQVRNDYFASGEWNWVSWLRSFLFLRTTFFRWDWKDPMPLLGAIYGWVALRLELRWNHWGIRRLLRRIIRGMKRV